MSGDVITRSAVGAKRVLQWVAFGAAFAASLFLLVVPIYTAVTSYEDGTTVYRSETLVTASGPWALVLLAVPVLITALPLLARGWAWQAVSIVACVALAAGVVVAIVTIGLFFVPALVVEIVAACLPTRRRPSAASRRAFVVEGETP